MSRNLTTTLAVLGTDKTISIALWAGLLNVRAMVDIIYDGNVAKLQQSQQQSSGQSFLNILLQPVPLTSKKLHRKITKVAHSECFLAHQVTRRE